MLFDAQNKEDLISKAKKRGEQAPRIYQKSVELYYIARYFVALFESRNHAIPIQVWNEYRNAFDHFFRHLTKVGLTPEEQEAQGVKTKTNQLKAMESHITRAVLDILKLSSHRSDEWFKIEEVKYSADILILVNNGSFSSETKKKYLEASSLFAKAKTYDHDFGVDVTTNKKIVNAYLDAVFAFEELRTLYEINTENIVNAHMQYNGLKDQAVVHAQKHSFFPNVKAGLATSLIVALISFSSGYLINYFNRDYAPVTLIKSPQKNEESSKEGEKKETTKSDQGKDKRAEKS